MSVRVLWRHEEHAGGLFFMMCIIHVTGIEKDHGSSYDWLMGTRSINGWWVNSILMA